MTLFKSSILTASISLIALAATSAEDLRDFSIEVNRTFERDYKLAIRTDGRNAKLNTSVWSKQGYDRGKLDADQVRRLLPAEISMLTALLAEIDLAKLQAVKKSSGFDGETWDLVFGSAEIDRVSFWSPSAEKKELKPLIALHDYLRELASKQ